MIIVPKDKYEEMKKSYNEFIAYLQTLTEEEIKEFFSHNIEPIKLNIKEKK